MTRYVIWIAGNDWMKIDEDETMKRKHVIVATEKKISSYAEVIAEDIAVP